MRELTALEIDQFDFTGRVPELNVVGYRNEAAAKMPVRKFNLKSQISAKRPVKRRGKIGIAQTA